MLHRWLALVLLSVSLVWAADARGAPGDVDPSFSSDGVVALPGAGSFVARKAAMDAAGRTVIAGYFCDPDPAVRDATCLESGNSSFRLARLTPDGGLDTDFGNAGFVLTKIIGDGRAQAQDLVLLPDGRFVVGGVATSGGRDVFALVRYLPNGAVDETFGPNRNGIVLQPIGPDYGLLAGLTEGPNGTLIASGQAIDALGRPRVAVARFTADGILDQTFGAGGVTLGGSAPYGFGLAVDAWPDGGSITGGIAGANAMKATYRFGELRLDGNGAPLAGFGSAGAAQHDIGAGAGFANAIVALPGGGWVSAGTAAIDNGNRYVMAVVRGTAAGGLDPTFANTGSALIAPSAGAAANDVLVQPDGRTIAVGQAEQNGAYVFATARLLFDGTLDPGFGRGGVAAVPFGLFPVARATSGILQPDGKIVTVGIGCIGGGTGTTCAGGTAILLAARQQGQPAVGPTPTPAPDRAGPKLQVSMPKRIGARALRRRGLRVRVAADELCRVRVTLQGRRPGQRRRRTLDRAQRQDPGVRHTVRLRARARTGRARVRVRARDAAGNRRSATFTIRVR